MRKLILGLCVFSSVAFANHDPLLSNGLSVGTEIELLADIHFAGSLFYVVDGESYWWRKSRPDQDQTYCLFQSNGTTDELKIAKAGEIYQVASIYPFQVTGGVGTKIELVRIDGNKQTTPAHLNSVLCAHSHVEITKMAPKIRMILRYELYVDEFKRLLKPYLNVR